MSQYFQKFTLLDLFNNKELKDKLPYINYRRVVKINYGHGFTTSIKTDTQTIFSKVADISTRSARPFYKPLKATRSVPTINIGGNLVGDQDDCVNAIYNAIVGQKTMLTLTANSADMIRDAIKESDTAFLQNGKQSKLYLRVASIEEIKGMSDKQIYNLMKDVMENIMYGDDFAKTQMKYGVKERVDLIVKESAPYEIQQENWKRKVGQ